MRNAKWEEFDLTEKVWSIPATKMKMRRDHIVPLPDQAIALLEQLRAMNNKGDYLLPSLRTWTRPMSENTLNAALRRMGYAGDEMTAHGFRASFSTLANKSGLWNPDAIEHALAHVEKNEVRRAYLTSAIVVAASLASRLCSISSMTDVTFRCSACSTEQSGFCSLAAVAIRLSSNAR